jgi:uncharacterized protein
VRSRGWFPKLDPKPDRMEDSFPGDPWEFGTVGRPKNPRRVAAGPVATYYKPRGIPMSGLEEVGLDLDEFEAIRLADLEGLYQQQAAEGMGVSRQTFARVLESGRRKVADALVHGKALRIEGLEPAPGTRYCAQCRHAWIHPPKEGMPTCPDCGDGAPEAGHSR